MGNRWVIASLMLDDVGVESLQRLCVTNTFVVGTFSLYGEEIGAS